MVKNMKYRIKNEKLAELVYAVFDEEDVQKEISRQINAGRYGINFDSMGNYKTKMKPDLENMKDWQRKISICISREEIEQI